MRPELNWTVSRTELFSQQCEGGRDELEPSLIDWNEPQECNKVLFRLKAVA